MINAANHDFRLKMARQKAEALLREEGVTTLPIDPFAIAASRDITIKPIGHAQGGVSGMLLRHGDEFGIMYATHIDNEGFQRFSIAHELGHYFLEGHIVHVLPTDSSHASHAGFISSDPYELEADNFAAGLLMPTALFKQAMFRQQAGLEAIEELSKLCGTSMTATAIRYAELTEDAVAVIISTGSTIDFCFFSNTTKLLPEITWFRKGTPIPRGTATAQLNADSHRIAAADRLERNIDIMDWLGGSRSLPATEQVLGLGSYGKTLTVLSCSDIQEETFEEDEDDEEDTVDRFRR